MLRNRFARALNLIALSLLLAAPAAMASGGLRAEGRFFRDSQGRAVLLRGVNVSNASKMPPFRPLEDLNQLDWIRDFGLNNIRLLFIWEAFEPERGQYDFAYLEELRALVRAASARGITTVIDFHSDSFSRYLIQGCGSGFPKWTLPPEVKPATPDNGQKCKLWGLMAVQSYSLGGDIAKMARNFYSDRTGVRTRFLLAWREIARAFRDEPGVIGYDILNEPFASELTEIAPLYEDAARVIRAEDPDSILFLEPSVMTVNGTALTALPRPPIENIAYAGHNYDPIILGYQTWRTGKIFLERGLKDILRTSERWQAPVYIGEFGVAGEGRKLTDAIEYTYSRFNELYLSGAQWSFTPTWNPIDKDGWDVEDMSIVDAFGDPRANFRIRPYPKEVSGTPIRYSLEGSDPFERMALYLEWDHVPASGETRIFFPETIQRHLGQVELEVLTDSPQDPELRCEQDETRAHFVCSSPVPGRKRVYIKRKPLFIESIWPERATPVAAKSPKRTT